MGELVDLEVCEISLVDRPATGRRFRVYKSEPDRYGEARIASLVRRLLAGKEAAVVDSAVEERSAESNIEEIQKAIRALDEAVRQAVERIERLEQVGPVRQSAVAETSPESGSRLWKGVL